MVRISLLVWHNSVYQFAYEENVTHIICLFFLSITERTGIVDSEGKSSCPANRYDGIGVAINNMGYAGLGGNSTTMFHDFWEFNPATNKWAQKASFPGKGRFCPTTFVIGHKVYVVAGLDSTTANSLTECWVYDANANTWTQKSNFPGGSRDAAFGFSIGNKGIHRNW